MKRAAIYARYSSDNQKETSLEDQINSCRRYAAVNDFLVAPEHIYTDAATSGTLRERDGLSRLLQAAKENQFDVVLVDDLSRLSRNNIHMLSRIDELSFYEVTLHSVSDNLNTGAEETKLLTQIKGILNEQFIDNLRNSTLRGQLGQKERGFFVGEKAYGYESEPFGEVKIDKKGRPRPEGYVMHIVPYEAAVVTTIFKLCAEGKSLRNIVKQLNEENVPSRRGVAKGWSFGTLHRMLRNEKYIGHWVWGKKKNKRNSSGDIRQVKRDVPLSDKTYEHLRIIQPELWERVQARLREVTAYWKKTEKGKKGFCNGNSGRAATHPQELLSGAMVCSECGGSIIKVSGKSGGYYGCIMAPRGRCSNKLMVKKSIAEQLILAEVSKHINNPSSIQYVMQKVEKLVAKMCAAVPEEMLAKKSELTKLQKMVDNFVKFISEGRSSKSIGDSLLLSEQKMEVLQAELKTMESNSRNAFKAPPMEWIVDRVEHVKEVLEEQTEQSALLLRKLLGKITLQPVTPDIGKPYLMAVSKFQPLALFEEKRPRKGPSLLASDSVRVTGSNTLYWWR